MTTLLPHLTYESGATPKHSIIWLHGLGADGGDFLPVAESFNLPVAVRYIFPHAPMQPVTINGGYVMRAWYDIVDTQIGGRQDAAGIRASQAAIEALIAQEVALGIPHRNIFLAGFSQGGAIVLHTALRQPKPLGGVLALSTYCPLLETLPNEMSMNAKTNPIFMAHGRSDSVVPYSLGSKSKDALLALGCNLEWHEYAMPHSVCDEELRDLESWLVRRLQ